MCYFQKSCEQSNYNIAAKCLYNSEFQSEDNVSWKYRTRFLSPPPSSPILSDGFPSLPTLPDTKLLGLVAYHSRTKFLFEILLSVRFYRQLVNSHKKSNDSHNDPRNNEIYLLSRYLMNTKMEKLNMKAFEGQKRLKTYM